MDTKPYPTNKETRIRLMPESLANQIAAGEVVQRPASVIKELLENALDAGSQRLILQLREAGKNLIQLIDDGSGMSPLDARMAFERHATSKLFTLDDLFRIQTMGFRGEALASIAAVAQVELRTCLHGEEVGTLIRIEGGHFSGQECCVTPAGTSITVQNLFFNVPARRNFLKSNPVEMRHIHQEFLRLALAYPNLHFELHHNGQPQHVLIPSLAQDRITTLLNLPADSMVEIHSPDDFLGIQGWIMHPKAGRSSKQEQYFWINGRYIRSSYLNHAVARAYESVMQSVEQPFFFLHLTTNPQNIDINIHPTKTEVKFSEEARSYQLVFQAVRNALSREFSAGFSGAFSPHFSSIPTTNDDPNKKPAQEEISVRPRLSSSTAPPWLDRTNAEHLSGKNSKFNSSDSIAGNQSIEQSHEKPMFEVQPIKIHSLHAGFALVHLEDSSWLVNCLQLSEMTKVLVSVENDILESFQTKMDDYIEKPTILLSPIEILAWPHIEPVLLDLGIRAELTHTNIVQLIAQPAGLDGLLEIKNKFSDFFDDVPSLGTITEHERRTNPKSYTTNQLVRIWLKLGKPSHDATGFRLALNLDEQACKRLAEIFF